MALSQLVDLLKSDERGIRSQAAYYIGEQGMVAVEAVPALIELIKEDEPEYLISSALSALGKVGGGQEQTIPTLFRAFSQEPAGSRWYAAEGLVNLGKAAVPSLLEGTRSEIVSEEMWSHVALAQILGFDTVHFQIILDAFSSDNCARSAIALRGLAMMGTSLPAHTLPLLLDALNRHREDCTSTTEILAIIGDMRKKATPAIPEIIPLLDHPDHMVRIRAVQALGQIGGEATVPAIPSLIRLLERSKDLSDRASWIELDGPGGGRILTTEPHVPPRYIVATLGEIGPQVETAAPKLVELLHHRLSGSLDRNVASGLFKIATDPAEFRPELIVALNKHGTADAFTEIYLSSVVQINREWVDLFLQLFEQNQISERQIRRLYFALSSEERERLPIEFFQDEPTLILLN
ncbi:MAG: hypothetical protein SynsKO_02530 [Synoicihabitans sp.]